MPKVILITGTSTGFGHLTALTLAKQGHTVYATMRQPDSRNAQQARKLSAAGANILELDVSNPASIESAISVLLTQEKRLDVLINNAGIAAAGISESFAPEQVQKLFEVNVLGVLRMTQAVLPTMREQKDGLIINIGSILGRISFPFFGLYGASKYAVEAMTDSFRYELSQLGIDVALIQPSAYPTNMYNSAIIPNNEGIATEYGEIAKIPTAINQVLSSIFNAEQPPAPQEVADAISQLIKQPKGKRELRTVVGASFGADAANMQIAPIQSELISSLELSYLEHIKTSI